MAGNVSFGEIETRIRRDLVKDDNPAQMRWSVFQVMLAIDHSVFDVVSRYNAWAGYDQNTGRRIYDIRSTVIERYCSMDMASLSTTDSFEVGGTVKNAEQFVAYLRAMKIPIDDRYADAVSYLAAAKLLDTGVQDSVSGAKMAEFMSIGKEHALR